MLTNEQGGWRGRVHGNGLLASSDLSAFLPANVTKIMEMRMMRACISTLWTMLVKGAQYYNWAHWDFDRNKWYLGDEHTYSADDAYHSIREVREVTLMSKVRTHSSFVEGNGEVLFDVHNRRVFGRTFEEYWYGGRFYAVDHQATSLLDQDGTDVDLITFARLEPGATAWRRTRTGAGEGGCCERAGGGARGRHGVRKVGKFRRSGMRRGRRLFLTMIVNNVTKSVETVIDVSTVVQGVVNVGIGVFVEPVRSLVADIDCAMQGTHAEMTGVSTTTLTEMPRVSTTVDLRPVYFVSDKLSGTSPYTSERVEQTRENLMFFIGFAGHPTRTLIDKSSSQKHKVVGASQVVYTKTLGNNWPLKSQCSQIPEVSYNALDAMLALWLKGFTEWSVSHLDDQPSPIETSVQVLQSYGVSFEAESRPRSYDWSWPTPCTS